MTSTSLIRLAALAAIAAILGGCTDLQEQLPSTTTAGAKVHPEGWIVPASADFHGKAVRASGWDLTSCQRCHSSQYTGGTAGVTCTTCHSQPAGPEDCKTCHGGVNAAPPKDIDGNTVVTAPGVGAHQFHLVSATTGRLVVCAECHTVPASLEDSAHVDASLPADVLFNGTLARKMTAAGVAPNPFYNYATHTCSGTYCHGTFENGNTTNAPVWNAPAGTGAACGTCHGTTSGGTTAQKALPKTAATGGDHPSFTQCSWCHNAVVDVNTNIIDGTKHVDGQVALFQYSNPADCARCHGSGTNAAPPTDLAGNSARTAPGVGAHQIHVASSTDGRTVPCSECHTVPTTLAYDGADGHLDSAAGSAELVFGALARMASTGVTPNPSYSFANRTCAGTYCHGSFANGNTTNSVLWNGSAGTGAECGTCHGNAAAATTPLKALPKTAANGGTHPTDTRCSLCHTDVIDANTVITDKTKHVDGQVALFQYSGPADCARCHGSATNPAPPTDLTGNTARTSPGVGAHQIHVAGSTGGRTVPCAECHVVPTNLDYTGADGHLDAAGGSAELAFGALSRHVTTGVTPNPVYTFNDRTCAGTYCHGSFANGNTANAAVWNGSAGTGAECGTCHGNTAAATTPLKALPKTTANGGTHPNYTQCAMCHTGVVDGNTVITDVSKHVDGQVALFQWSGPADCAHCHGSATNAAPPTDLSGNTATTARGVGAHQAHVAATTAKVVKCAECHAIPATLDYTGADGHMEGTELAEVTMADTLARLSTDAGASVPNPTYGASTQSCSNTYCHGTFKWGNSSNVASWTNPTSAACGTCHGNAGTGSPLPPSPHPQTLPSANNCQTCHTVSGETAVATFNSSAGTWSITNAARHLNGRRNTFNTEGTF